MWREEFVVWLLDPTQSDTCRDQLGVTRLSAGEIDGLINQARVHVNPCEAKIAIHMREQSSSPRAANPLNGSASESSPTLVPPTS